MGLANIYGAHSYPPGLNIANAHVIYNLCVSNEFRGGGVGRQLIDAVRLRFKGPIYLFVLTEGIDSNEKHISNTMLDRVKRLETTYARLGLTRVGEVSNKILFQVA